MSPAPSPRFGLVAVGGGDYIHDVDTIDQAQVAILDANAAMFQHGTLAARPVSSGVTAGITGRFYLATDQTPQQLH